MTAKVPIASGFQGSETVRWGHNKSDPARCVNTMCAGPCRTGLEFDS